MHIYNVDLLSLSSSHLTLSLGYILLYYYYDIYLCLSTFFYSFSLAKLWPFNLHILFLMIRYYRGFKLKMTNLPLLSSCNIMEEEEDYRFLI
jgi:hypothetical protein